MRETFPLLCFKTRTLQPGTGSLNGKLEQVTVLSEKKHKVQTEEQKQIQIKNYFLHISEYSFDSIVLVSSSLKDIY
jgi:hypothetical protein